MKTILYISRLQSIKSKKRAVFFTYKYILLLFFTISFSSFTKAQDQNKIDSLTTVFNTASDPKDQINAAKSLFQMTLHLDRPNSLNYVLKYIELAKQHNNTKELGTGYNDLGMYYRFESKPDSSRFYYKKAIGLLQKIPPSSRLLKAYDDYGTMEALQGNINTSLDILEEGYVVAEKIKNGFGMALLLKRRAFILTDAARYIDASNTLIKASKITDTLKEPKPLLRGDLLGATGRIEMIRGNHEIALNYFEKSHVIYEKLNHAERLAIVLNEIGI